MGSNLHKMYVRGVGNVFEQTVKGDNERAELVPSREAASGSKPPARPLPEGEKTCSHRLDE